MNNLAGLWTFHSHLTYIISQRTFIKHAVAEDMMEENDLGRWEGRQKGVESERGNDYCGGRADSVWPV